PTQLPVDVPSRANRAELAQSWELSGKQPWADYKPEERGKLRDQNAAERNLISDRGIAAVLFVPLLDDNAKGPLHDERGPEVKCIQDTMGAAGHLLRKMFRQDRIAQHCRRTGTGYDRPRQVRGQSQH